jgi:hypothetical protein
MLLRSSAFVLVAAGLALAADPPQLQFNIKWVNPPVKALPRGVSHKVLMSKAMGVEVGYHIYLPPSYEKLFRALPGSLLAPRGGQRRKRRLAHCGDVRQGN